MFWDFVKYTIIMRAGLNHCFPERGVDEKSLPGPVSAVWQRTAESTDLSAVCHRLQNHPGCACCPSLTARMGNRHLLLPAPPPPPLMFPLRWAWWRLKSGGSCYTSLPVAQNRHPVWGGEGVSTSDSDSWVSSVCSLHVRASQGGWQSPARAWWCCSCTPGVHTGLI